jgi:hypothetical protein
MRLDLDRLALLGIAAIAAVAGAGAGAAGCATPAPIYRLTPRSNEVYWIAGRPSMQKEAAGVRAAVAFEHQDGETLRLRVEMINQSDARFDVKPTDFSFVTCTSDTVASCGAAKPIVDPELVLGALDDRESRERADAVNDQAVWVPLLLLSAAAEVGAAAKGHGGSLGVLRTAAIADHMDSNEARHDSAAQSIGAQRDMWTNAAFRRNTLAPGGGTAGFVTNPIETDVKYVWLTVRAAGQRLPFCFEQSVKQVLAP